LDVCFEVGKEGRQEKGLKQKREKRSTKINEEGPRLTGPERGLAPKDVQIDGAPYQAGGRERAGSVGKNSLNRKKSN